MYQSARHSHMHRPNSRKGFALMDVLIGGVMLGIGLAVTLSIASRSITAQSNGEKQMTAAWLLDELLSMVLVEGPVEFSHVQATRGKFDPPFDNYEFDVNLEDLGVGQPFLVTATVRWVMGHSTRQVQAQTYIALRNDEPYEDRLPLEPIDRISRWYDDEE